MTKNSMALSRPYATMDDAALGGFKKVMTSFPDYKSYEYGFLVVSFDRPAKPNEITLAKVVPAVSILFPDTMPEYYYTTPVSDQERSKVNVEFSPFNAHARAWCHTHPTAGTFSITDAASFKLLEDKKRKNILRYDITAYLLQSDGQVRRSSPGQDFFKGELISGLDKAHP